jgi:hypothetical protein
MIRVDQLRAEAQKLYDEAAAVVNGDERLILILRALELQADADLIEGGGDPFAPSFVRAIGNDRKRA